jgi:hypothetical protein
MGGSVIRCTTVMSPAGPTHEFNLLIGFIILIGIVDGLVLRLPLEFPDNGLYLLYSYNLSALQLIY